jgi:hypothetical protein
MIFGYFFPPSSLYSFVNTHEKHKQVRKLECRSPPPSTIKIKHKSMKEFIEIPSYTFRWEAPFYDHLSREHSKGLRRKIWREDGGQLNNNFQPTNSRWARRFSSLAFPFLCTTQKKEFFRNWFNRLNIKMIQPPVGVCWRIEKQQSKTIFFSASVNLHELPDEKGIEVIKIMLIKKTFIDNAIIFCDQH